MVVRGHGSVCLYLFSGWSVQDCCVGPSSVMRPESEELFCKHWSPWLFMT